MFCAQARGKRRPFPNQSIFRDFLRYEFDVRQERSKINQSIISIVGESSRYREMLYVGYTATPFANLLNEDPTQDPLCPDCIIPLTTSSKYIGLERIFGSDVSGKPYNMDIIRDISEDEEDAWVLPIHQSKLEGNILPSLKRSHQCEDGKTIEVEWTSLKKAIQWAYCTAAARRAMRLAGSHNNDDADTDYRWTTMLFNISQYSNQENGAHPVQERIVSAYLQYVNTDANKKTFIQECMALWREETRKFTRVDFVNACPNYDEPMTYPSDDAVERALREWFLSYAFGQKVKVIQMNAAVGHVSSVYMDYNSAAESGDVLWIVCGGNAISRGLTLKGLTVSYYDRIRESSAVDSITQMGRWFGYRIGYELLPRIWMTKETVAEMKNICRIETLLHESLAKAFYPDGEEGADKTSFRKGRPIGDIRYFGRRLSGRDANAMEIPGAGVECVFATVADDPSKALEITRKWITQELGLANCATASENAGDLRKRHPYYWQGVHSDKIIAYIRSMSDVCFRGASMNRAEGVLIDIAKRGDAPWNVVIGNPSTQIPFEQIDGITDVHMASRALNRQPDGTVRIGNSSVVESNAYMTGIPAEIIQQAKNELGASARGNDIIVGKAFSLASKRGLTEATRPVLQIGFVRPSNLAGQTFVQVSFYWHGHDNGSFLRAIVDPTRPTRMPRAIEIIKQQGYISRLALFRLLDIAPGTVEERNVREELCALCAEDNAPIRMVEDGDADESILEHNIVYSVEWLEKEKVVNVNKTVGQIIGEHLYKMIVERGWNHWERRWLDYKALTENGYDYVMAYCWNMKPRQYKWNEFRNHYQYCDMKFELPQKVTPSPNHKKSARSRGRGWEGLIQCVLEPDEK